MKIAVVTPIPIFPAHGGNRARLMTLLETLRDLGHEITLIILTSRQMGDFDRAAHEQVFGDKLHVLGRSSVDNALYMAGRAAGLATKAIKRRLGITVHHHASVDEVYFRPFTRDLRRIFAADKPDVCLVEYAYFSKAFEACPAGTLKILDTHDSFAHELSPDEERRGLMRADAVLAIQDDEARTFRALLGDAGDRVHVVSHIVSPTAPVPVESTLGATFLGSSFAANIVSLTYLIEEILPLIVAQMPDFRLMIAGSICKDAPDGPNIVKLGRVEQVRDAFVDGPILVNAIRAGTGVKIKLLEAMALGLPVVSTESGVRGISDDLLPGVVRVADEDAQGFADAVVALVRDRDRRIALGQASGAAVDLWNSRQIGALETVLSQR